MIRVLLIEPDRVLASTYMQALKAHDFEVIPCASAQAAIFACDQKLPDLIILEPQLIEHSGIEFLYELRSYPEWQGIPIIIHSQIALNEFSSHLQMLKKNLGVKDYLYKPQTNLSILIKTVKRYTKVSA